MVDTELCKRIKQLREALNLNQQAFAREINVSQGNIADVENERREPSKEFIRKILDKYRVNANWVLTGMPPIFLEDRILLSRRDSKKLVEWGLLRDVSEDYTGSTDLIKLINHVPAGNIYLEDSPIADYLKIPMITSHSFALLVRGNSMAEKYLDGDVIVLKECTEFSVKNGNDYAIMTETQTTFKRVFRGTKDGVMCWRLVPRNPAYQEEIVFELRKLFEVIVHVRYFKDGDQRE